MYWIIEDKNQLRKFWQSGYKKCFIEVIPLNPFEHPQENNISLVYLRPLEATKGFMLGINHNETLNEIPNLSKFLRKFEKLYCRDKKEILHYYALPNLYDINISPQKEEIEFTLTHNFFYKNNPEYKEINTIIPIVKHYELCEDIFNKLKDNIGQEDEYSDFFNKNTSLVFNYIERNPLSVNVKKFEEYFHLLEKPYVHTKFNIKTTTTRPANAFKGVNYAALNKKNGCRESFIPKNDMFVEIDMSAYHPYLSTRLIDYEFQYEDVHAHFAELYNVDYDEAKKLTFKQLNGGVFKQYQHLEYFQKITELINKNWELYNTNGYLKCPISGFKFRQDKLTNMNPQKLFNYLMQNMETSLNILILKDIIKLLIGKNTKLVLYTYDSFLFDWDETEQELIEQIREIFTKYKLKTKEKSGYNYQDLK